MKTTVNVYLLLINKESKIGLLKYGNKNLVIYPEPIGINNGDGNGSIPVLFYFTLPQSDLEISKIKEGNWYYDKTKEDVVFPSFNIKTGKNKSFRANPIEFCETKDLADFLNIRNNCEKIIASTDKSFGGNTLPSIPKTFIDFFISGHNRGNIIRQVEVELNEDLISELMSGREWGDKKALDANGTRSFYMKSNIKLKLNQNNEVVVILPEQKMYSRKEVIKLLSKIAVERTCNHCEEPYDWDINNSDNFLQDWIKDNLK